MREITYDYSTQWDDNEPWLEFVFLINYTGSPVRGDPYLAAEIEVDWDSATLLYVVVVAGGLRTVIPVQAGGMSREGAEKWFRAKIKNTTEGVRHSIEAKCRQDYERETTNA